MRRGFRIAGVLAALLFVLLWGLRAVDNTPKGTSLRPRLPALAREEAGANEADVAPMRRADSGRATVLCHVDGVGDQGVLEGVRLDDGGGEPGVTVTSTNAFGDLVLSLEPGSWRVSWVVPEAGAFVRPHVLGVFDLLEGDVRTCSFDRSGFIVHGRVVDPVGRPLAGAEVTGCAIDGPSGEDGSFVGTIPLFAIGASGCELRARFEDGLLARYGAAVRVGPFDAQTVIELVVDDRPVAGLGVAIDATPEGVVVSHVHPGTPADRAGLMDGDLIAKIDGTSTRGMSIWDFIGLGTGTEGTTARLDVVGEDGQTEQVTLRRERLEQPRVGER